MVHYSWCIRLVMFKCSRVLWRCTLHSADQNRAHWEHLTNSFRVLYYSSRDLNFDPEARPRFGTVLAMWRLQRPVCTVSLSMLVYNKGSADVFLPLASGMWCSNPHLSNIFLWATKADLKGRAFANCKHWKWLRSQTHVIEAVFWTSPIAMASSLAVLGHTVYGSNLQWAQLRCNQSRSTVRNGWMYHQ